VLAWRRFAPLVDADQRKAIVDWVEWRGSSSQSAGSNNFAFEFRKRTMSIAQCRSFLGTKLGWAVTLSLAAFGAYLLLTHKGHVVYALPFLLLLACPLMHVFGHHHGHNHKQENAK
jgi:hypothetical protein